MGAVFREPVVFFGAGNGRSDAPGWFGMKLLSPSRWARGTEFEKIPWAGDARFRGIPRIPRPARRERLPEPVFILSSNGGGFLAPHGGRETGCCHGACSEFERGFPAPRGERETCGKAADSRGSASRVLNPGTAMEDRTGRKNRGCAAVFSAPRAGAAGKPVRERGFFREICRSRREPEGLPAEKTV